MATKAARTGGARGGASGAVVGGGGALNPERGGTGERAAGTEPAPPPAQGRGRGRTGRHDGRRGALAVGYLRRSTDRQEQSIPDQKRALERYCAEHHLRVLRWYTDDAVSGASSLARRAFQELIADAQKPGCDFGVIVVYDVKRFGRVDNDEAGYYRHVLRQHGVEVRYASENFAGDGTDDLLRPVKQWQAREESKDLSKVTIRGLLTRSTSGCWMGGAPPFGYDLRYESQSGQFMLRLRYNADGTKGVLGDEGGLLRTLERGESIAVTRRDRCRLVLGDPGRVEAVRRIFRMYAQEGRGFKAIADALNRDRVPTARSAAWAAQYSGQWAMTTVRAILVNPAYCGDMVWNRRTDARFHRIEQGRAVLRQEVLGRRLECNDRADWVVVRDAHPPLVPRGTWEHAQQQLAGRPASAAQRGVNPRTGAVVGEHRGAGGPGAVGGWTGPRARFLLSGLCSCVRCGSRYEGYTDRSSKPLADGGRTKWYSYACGGAIRRGPSVCRLGLVRREVLETAVVTAVLGYYARYAGAAGTARLREAAGRALGEGQTRIQGQRGALAARLHTVEETIRNLLDNMTAANRALVDERAAELSAERERLRARAGELARHAAGEAELRHAAKAAAEFLAGLPEALRTDDLAQRRAAVRQCVTRVWVDHEQRKASAELLRVPTLPASCAGAVETVSLAL